MKQVFPAGTHTVVRVAHGEMRVDLYRQEPCARCPWRRDAKGIFPPEAFKISACTSQPDSTDVFACHESGTEKPQVCAGFLLRGASKNKTVRVQKEHGIVNTATVSTPVPLFDSYREMAIANGVAPDDPCLNPE